MNKKELIDYAMVKHNMTLKDATESVDSYFKFKNELINSNEPNEFRAIGNNENTQEKCERCKKLEFMIDNGLGWDDMKNDV